MPPKLSEAAIDGKLVALRDYVRCHREELACRGSSNVFAARRNNEESRFYKFLHKYEARFTEAQRRHLRETLAPLAQHRESSGGAQCAAKAEQSHGIVAAASGLSPVEESVSARSSTAPGQRRLHKRAAEHLCPVAPSKRLLERNIANVSTVVSQFPAPSTSNGDSCPGSHVEDAGEGASPAKICSDDIQLDAGASSSVMVKSIHEPWCDDVAAGLKFFECVANRQRFANQFMRLKAGDLFAIV